MKADDPDAILARGVTTKLEPRKIAKPKDRLVRFGSEEERQRALLKEIAPLRLDLSPFDTKTIPAREWGVHDRFPRRAVALLSGHGGAGKSLLLLQLSVAHVLGRDWLRS